MCPFVRKHHASQILVEPEKETSVKYFIQFKGSVKCSKMQAALDKAETLVSMGDFYFLNNVWNAQSSMKMKRKSNNNN